MKRPPRHQLKVSARALSPAPYLLRPSSLLLERSRTEFAEIDGRAEIEELCEMHLSWLIYPAMADFE